MILGIGIDMVSIREMKGLMESLSKGSLEKMFTKAEIAASMGRRIPEEYLAGRFAAKEAVFKALRPLMDDDSFDLRTVETLSRDDGSPYINCEGEIKQLLENVGVVRVHISITTQDDMAAAFVIAES